MNLGTKFRSVKPGRRLAASAGALAFAATALLAGAGQASATDTTIGSWNTSDAPVRCVNYSNGVWTYLCLYYSQGANGAIDVEPGGDNMTISAYFQADQYGSAGAGQPVRNNAASAENPTARCMDVIHVSPWDMGDTNYLPAGRGGNLSWNLRNNEASWYSYCF